MAMLLQVLVVLLQKKADETIVLFDATWLLAATERSSELRVIEKV